MTLATELRKAGVHWTIDLVNVPQLSTRYPGVVHQVTRTRICVTGVLPPTTDDSPQKSAEILLSSARDWTLDELLAFAMRTLAPKHGAYQGWLASKGHRPAKVRLDLLDESIGECIHSALRKLCDGPLSAIQWNAIRHLLPADWSQLLEMAREEIRNVTAERINAGKAGPSHYDIGMAIKRAFVDRFDEVTHRGWEGVDKKPERTELQAFALLSLHMANKEADDQDFVWGWAGYLCDALDVEQAALPAAG